LGRHTLGVLFSSTLFPGRAPDGRVLLTAFIGGARNPGVVDQDDEMLIDQIKADLGPLLGIRGDPVYARLTLWPKAIPQYELGHLHRLAQIDARLAQWPGLHLRANWREGISVSDCAQNALNLATLIGPA
jgi:oxygen-dependent protoporphyrinogen oxidase